MPSELLFYDFPSLGSPKNAKTESGQTVAEVKISQRNRPERKYVSFSQCDARTRVSYLRPGRRLCQLQTPRPDRGVSKQLLAVVLCLTAVTASN